MSNESPSAESLHFPVLLRLHFSQPPRSLHDGCFSFRARHTMHFPGCLLSKVEDLGMFDFASNRSPSPMTAAARSALLLTSDLKVS